MKLTVGQLRTVLESYPENARILVEGYEGGFAEIGKIKETKVKLDHNSEDWLGPHDEVEGADTPAVIFIRAPNPNALEP